MTARIEGSWRELERWTSQRLTSIRSEARLISARADCLQRAIKRSEDIATGRIAREFHELDLREVINDVLAVLRQCLIVMVTSTGGGALIGGVAGGIGGVGVGAIPGVAVGAAAGAQVGEWILIVMGLKVLTEYIVRDMPAIACNYRDGLRQAWLAASPPALPQQQVQVDAFALQSAAATLARGHVAMFVLLLMGIVAYLARGRGTIGELADNMRSSKLGARFADWMVRNEGKLREKPWLQSRAGSDEEQQWLRQRTHRIDQTVTSQKTEQRPGTRQSPARAQVIYRSADEVNAVFPSGWKPPYKSGTQVKEYTTTVDDQFVRVHNSENQEGAWIMRKESIQDMTPEQIAKKYSLPTIPTLISDVKIPAGTRIRMGKAAANFGGNEGATQYQLLQRLSTDAFTNPRPMSGSH